MRVLSQLIVLLKLNLKYLCTTDAYMHINAASIVIDKYVYNYTALHLPKTTVNTKVTISTKDNNDIPTRSPSQDPTSEKKLSEV